MTDTAWRSHPVLAMQWLTAKKEAYAEAPFRQGHRSVPDSQSGRLQMLTPDQDALSLRLDGPSHARMTVDHLVSHVA